MINCMKQTLLLTFCEMSLKEKLPPVVPFMPAIVAREQKNDVTTGPVSFLICFLIVSCSSSTSFKQSSLRTLLVPDPNLF